MENELAKHVDLIEDPAIKEYIQKKKAQKIVAKEARQSKNSGIRSKLLDLDDDMQIEESEEDVKKEKKLKQKQIQKVGVQTQKKIAKISKQHNAIIRKVVKKEK